MHHFWWVIQDATSQYAYELPKHPRKDNIIGFVRGHVQVKVGNNDYLADVILADRKSGGIIFYDIVEMIPTKIKTAIEPTSQKNGAGEPTTVYGQNISQSESDVNSVMNEGTDLRRSLRVTDKQTLDLSDIRYSFNIVNLALRFL